MSISFDRLDRQPSESPAAIVARRLVADIRAETLRPGDRLPPERQLAQEFGVGRSALREALRALALLGLVEIRQSEGAFVTSPATGTSLDPIGRSSLLDARQLRDLADARAGLIEEVAALAAGRQRGIAGADLELVLADAARATGDPDRLVASDAAFFRELAQTAHSPALARAVACLGELLRNPLARSLSLPGATEAWLLDLRAIAAAVMTSDVTAARSAAAAHAEATSVRLASLSGGVGPGGPAPERSSTPPPGR